MRRYWNLFQKAIARLLAFTILSTSTLAFASLPGEDKDYTQENVGGSGGNAEALFSNSNYAEARTPDGTYIRVWRGLDNQVTISRQDGFPFTIGNTQTAFAPSVAYYGGNLFLIAHTGNDRNIYYTFYNISNGSDTGWAAVPGQATAGPVSLVNVNAGANFVYMVFLGTDFRLLGEYISNGEWVFTGQMATGRSTTAPSVTYSSANQTLYAVVAVSGQVWWTWQAFGSNVWANWQTIDADGDSTPVNDTPYIAAVGNGNLVVSATDISGNPYFREFNYAMVPTANWSRDTSGFQTSHTVFLTAFRGVVFALLTGLNQVGYWKQLANR